MEKLNNIKVTLLLIKEVFSIKRLLNQKILSTKEIKVTLFILLIIYLSAVFYITFLAWNYGASLGPVGPGGRNYNIIPFRSIYRISVYSPDIIDPIKILLGNVVLFLPFGFLLPAVWRKMTLLKISVLGMLLSILIEVNQFLFTFRVANIDDVILNTAGAIIGGVFFFFCRWIKRRLIIYIP